MQKKLLKKTSTSHCARTTAQPDTLANIIVTKLTQNPAARISTISSEQSRKIAVPRIKPKAT